MTDPRELAAALESFERFPPQMTVKKGQCALDKLPVLPGMGVIVVATDEGGIYAVVLHGNCLGKIEKLAKEAS